MQENQKVIECFPNYSIPIRVVLKQALIERTTSTRRASFKPTVLNGVGLHCVGLTKKHPEHFRL